MKHWLVLLSLLIPTTGHAACECALEREMLGTPLPTVAESRERVTHIFSGEVMQVRRNRLGEEEARIQVQSVWQGVKQPLIIVQERDVCAVRFQQGQNYLIYANGNPKYGYVTASRCERTRTLEQAEEDIKTLGDVVWTPPTTEEDPM